MKKVLLLLVLGFVVLATGEVFADTVRALSIGAPIALVDDTFIINSFSSRLVNFPSSVFFGVSGATGNVTMFPGIALRLSDSFSLMYIYDQPDGSFGTVIPAALVIRTGLVGNEILHSPLNLWAGLKMGGMSLGVFYRLSYYDVTSTEGLNTNTAIVNDKDYGSYYVHTLSPSLTFMLDDKASAFDIAVNIGLQSLNNFEEDPAATNIVSVPGIRNIGVVAQLTMQMSPEFRLAFRLNANNQNNSFDDYTVLSGSNTTNSKLLQHINTLGLTVGLKYQIVPAIAVYFDLIGQLSQTYNGATISDTLTLPPSNNFGAEWIIDAWAFRVGMNTRYMLTTVNTIVDGRISAKSYSSSISYSPFLGIGYKALPWAINFIIDAQIFTKTVAMINTGAGFSPIVRFQLNYVF
ncbi:MAG: hypothetical protein A2Y33_01430 [Spirochaetes bacterium GWF1_51_8]|nr:MAG: hypothetical protein A2Y33_01430 [Spirochaetes bacterium GWF1_51_8]